MVDWKRLAKGTGEVLKTVLRATVADYDPATRTLWISGLTLLAALQRRNSSVGLFGVEVDATVIGDALRVDARPKPFGPSGRLVTDAMALHMTPAHYEIGCRVVESNASAALLLRAIPLVFDVMLGLGVDGPRARMEGDTFVYGAPLPRDSWFLALLRGLGGLQRPATIPITVGNGGLLLDLSDVLAPGVVLEASEVSRRLLAR